MTMDATRDEVEESVPTVNPSSSFAPLSEVGSAGSNSTKTRFSFYNAQEVQLVEEQQQSSNPLVIFSSAATTEKEQQEKQKQEEEEPPRNATEDCSDEQKEEDMKDIGLEEDSKNSEAVLSDKTTPSGSETHRYTFYVAEEVNNEAVDDRQSSATPVTTDEERNNNDDHTRTPAVASIDTNSVTVSSKTDLSSPVPTPVALAETPQRSNNASAQKKKQRAVAAAEARSKSKSSTRSRSNSQSSSKSSNLTTDTPRAGSDNHIDNTLDSVGILQSLKNTEQIQQDLLQECHPSDTENSVEAIRQQVDVSSNSQPHRPPQETNHAPLSAARLNGTGYLNPLQRSATATAALSQALSQDASRDANPYEDAIREALDLLRKHRPPSPERDNSAVHDILDTNLQTPSGVLARSVLQTPRENDRILQSRWHDSPPNHHHNPEELEARKKERQKRMEKYTTRLAELKNGEDSKQLSINQEKEKDNVAGAALCAKKGCEASSEENNAGQSGSPSPQNILPMPSEDLPANVTGDASVGTASSLSASHYHPQNSKEVHRSVERVLLAILERAHSNGRGSFNSTSSQSSSHLPLERTLDPSWQNGEEKKSSSEDVDESIQGGGNPSTPQQGDPLLRAVSELLSPSGGDSHATESPPRQSQQSSVTSGAKRSVVEELLAEAESFSCDMRPMGNNRSKSSSRNLNGRRVGENTCDPSSGVEAVHSDTDVTSVVVDKELDELVLRTLGNAESGVNQDLDSTSNDDGDDQKEYDEENDSGNSTYDDEGDASYDNHGGLDVNHDEDGDILEGVLGPLSKNAGTTGVVLESPDHSTGEQSFFDSLSNAMSSFVASAISAENNRASSQVGSTTKSFPRDRYTTDMDIVENDLEESTGTDPEDDEEANELMRSLCAHLLPFGVDQSNRFLDEVPRWDDSNPNEAGYRIIRLTSHQLERVEIAFEFMVHGLKKDSEQNLLDGNHRIATDATFERDLAAAEKLLEEEDRTTKIMKVLNLVPDTPTSVEDSRETDSDDESGSISADEGSLDAASTCVDECHPDFPGIHSAGKGEMGDLEYFQLPVIFKSHVTGFEPTKDLFLEPGNVVAGQYLVESELGSAAFSTAYRCVDLNSEGDDTEDGHQEVCLKVIKNTKDFFDQSLDEIKILELLRQTGKCHQNFIIEMKTFFYHREHLVIVTELLRQNLFEFGKFILDHDEEPYFTLTRMGCITRQILVALRFVHKLGLVHSDVKPENILLGSYSRAQVKLIDFGSSCYLTDRQSSYIQSRSYRAPEVILGLPYDGKIDVWSMGCVVAEMFTGEVTFQNDSIVSMLSRIEAICGPFPRHMIAQGRQSCRFFTKCGLLYEKVPGHEGEDKISDDTDDDDDSEAEKHNNRAVYDIFQPKATTLSSRLGLPPGLHDRFISGAPLSPAEQKQALFVDFVRKLLTIDPDSRPTAAEALKHPWMIYAASLTEDDVKYPSP